MPAPKKKKTLTQRYNSLRRLLVNLMHEVDEVNANPYSDLAFYMRQAREFLTRNPRVHR